MDGRRMGARALLLGVLGAWHVLVLQALMPRPHREVTGPEAVSVLRLVDAARPASRPDAPLLELSPVPDIPWQLLLPEPIRWTSEASSGPAQAPLPGSTVDWNEQAARAARSAAAALPVPEEPPARGAESYWTRPHEKGEEAPLGAGRWLVWVSEHCYTIVDHLAPSAAGQPMAVRCPRRAAPIDAEVLSKRRPRYLEPAGADTAR